MWGQQDPPFLQPWPGPSRLQATVLTWSPFRGGALASRKCLEFPAPFLWGLGGDPDFLAPGEGEQGEGPQVSTNGQLRAQGCPCAPCPEGLGLQRRRGWGGERSLRPRASSVQAQAAFSAQASSSLRQQHEEGSLQEAAEAAECGHEPVGAEARVGADHALEDVGLGGKT